MERGRAAPSHIPHSKARKPLLAALLHSKIQNKIQKTKKKHKKYTKNTTNTKNTKYIIQNTYSTLKG